MAKFGSFNRIGMNKKGDVSVTLLIFMALFLVITALYSFMVYSRINTSIADPRFLEKSYQKEEMYKIEIFTKGYENIVKDYYDKTQDYLSGNELEVSGFQIKDENGNVKNIDANKDKEMVSFISKEDFPIFDEITIKDKQSRWYWRIVPESVKDQQIKVLINSIYKPKIDVKINLTEMGLHDFDEIDSAVNQCKDSDNDKIRYCLSERLGNFDVSIDVKDNVKTALFNTKKKFYIDNQLRKIEISVKL
ncbi:hypothetical protein J4217_02745 [Candidatus Pacearchaeota archaeon]|nr:hypothetical protein [Candidatus Pacearchaeota archaeon]